jgi:zinc transport system substrate-binding protein
MIKRKAALVIAVGLLSIGLVACSDTATNSEGLSIYTSFYPVYDFTKRILKGHGTVTNITPAGSEPHDYELTADNVKGMENADAIFVNGLNLEPWLSSLTSSLSAKVFTVTTGITTRDIEGAVDPHVWLNPINAISELANIKNELITLDPNNSSDYEANYWDAMTLFEALDSSFESISGEFTNKYIVVSHAAFGYLCDRYGLDQIYVDGLSPDDEPSAEDISKIIDAVNTYHINTIFYEELISSEISDKIAEETGAKTEVLNPLEGLSADELETEDYSSVMIDNFRKLLAACKQ